MTITLPKTQGFPTGRGGDENHYDFSGHIQEIRTTTSQEKDIPPNWGICDGRAITMPDGTTQKTLDLRDKFLLSVSKTKALGTTGGRWTGDTGAHQLTQDESAAHTHRSYGPQHTSGVQPGSMPQIGASTAWWGDTNSSSIMISAGGNQSHVHENTDFTNPYYALYYIMRMF